jgi:hypothetical protein
MKWKLLEVGIGPGTPPTGASGSEGPVIEAVVGTSSVGITEPSDSGVGSGVGSLERLRAAFASSIKRVSNGDDIRIWTTKEFMK